MFVVKFEYGFNDHSHTESCVGFDTIQEAREFALIAVNEICDQIQDGIEVDNAIIRVWNADVDGDLIRDI